ncbi:MAG: GNAT family N-acetyltransferase [Saprospiraceae bacterium]
MKIRQETPLDFKSVYTLNHLAFKQEGESQLIEKIRMGDTFIPELSLVAEQDEKVIGHILFSKTKIIGEQTYPSLALAPMSVHPDFQNKKIGSELITIGLQIAKKLNFEHVIVLGHKNYYPKFGFQKASTWNIRCPFEVPDDHFMAIELVERSLENKGGLVEYPPVFYEV